MVVPTTLMSLSIFGIIGLFGLKFWEVKTGAVLFDGIRTKADDAARSVKRFLGAMTLHMRHLPSTVRLVGRYFVYLGAKATARFARQLETFAHRIVDRISHKNRFERRESSSSFLKKVREHKNSLGN